ncbi:hypothetical protein GWI33_020098 [Rhynchophorus ferrugineus]|uniref:Uncharacterized protein n=1 Tax=Rhynchophorus ferrugineus TaxID=354439 RepID=A0A834M0T1_RHYFE|nr:hypothetical protein GWI33_020098 [Rhynchophorus ferrugineus]
MPPAEGTPGAGASKSVGVGVVIISRTALRKLFVVDDPDGPPAGGGRQPGVRGRTFRNASDGRQLVVPAEGIRGASRSYLTYTIPDLDTGVYSSECVDFSTTSRE